MRTLAETLSLPPVLPPDPDPAFALMARFSSGPDHAPRRAAVVAALPDAVEVVAAVRSRVGLLLPAAGGLWDAMPAARDVPADALATVLGDTSTVPARSILFQARDATAALIGQALLTRLPAEQAVAQAVSEAPVRHTKRRDGGEVVVVELDGAPFGAGPHACPGADLAQAIAAGFVAEVQEAGWGLVTGQVVAEDPELPNLRLPLRLLLERS